MYVILGCGTVGTKVADLLAARGKDVAIIDQSEERVEALRERNLDAVLGDLRHLDFKKEPMHSADVVMVLTKNDQTNLKAIQQIKAQLSDAFVVARAGNPVSAEEMEEVGADYVLQVPDVIGRTIVKELAEVELIRQTDRLLKVIRSAGEKGLAIFTHNSPDPDCIAAAMALKTIAERENVAARIHYAGRIGHQQNRTLVNLLNLELTNLADGQEVEKVLQHAGKVALLDIEFTGRNNPLPRDLVPSIVIGHHEASEEVPGEYVDVRSDIGATTTILWTYLMELRITPSKELATAMLHAIRTDTSGFTRKCSPTDLRAAAYLSPLIDPKLLEQIESPPMSSETVDVMARAISGREVRGSYLVSSVGFITDRDALPQAADTLLKLEGIATVLVFGIMENEIQISARSKDSRVNVGQVLQEAFGKDYAGGHAQAAGGQINLGILGEVDNKDDLLDLAEKVIAKKFFKAVGAEDPKEKEKKKEEAASDGNGKNGNGNGHH